MRVHPPHPWHSAAWYNLPFSPPLRCPYSSRAFMSPFWRPISARRGKRFPCRSGFLPGLLFLSRPVRVIGPSVGLFPFLILLFACCCMPRAGLQTVSRPPARPRAQMNAPAPLHRRPCAQRNPCAQAPRETRVGGEEKETRGGSWFVPIASLRFRTPCIRCAPTVITQVSTHTSLHPRKKKRLLLGGVALSFGGNRGHRLCLVAVVSKQGPVRVNENRRFFGVRTADLGDFASALFRVYR